MIVGCGRVSHYPFKVYLPYFKMAAPIDEIDLEDEWTVFHKDLLEMVKAVYHHDRTQGANPSKKFVEYVKAAPRHGLETTLSDIRQSLSDFYQKNRDDLKQGYDDPIFKGEPLLLKVSRKIYMPVGNIYTRAKDDQLDALHGAIIRVLIHVATDPNDKTELEKLAGSKEKKGEGGGFMSVIQGMMSGAEGGGLGEILGEIKDKLGGVMGDAENPEAMDPGKIGEFVKSLISDRSDSGLFSKMTKNPALAGMAEKMAKEGTGLKF